MILNINYYRDLLELTQKSISSNSYHDVKISELTTKLILSNYRNKKAIHFNFQNQDNILFGIAKSLFIELANYIFINKADFPPLNIGSELRCLNSFCLHNNSSKYINFIIYKIEDDNYFLFNDKYKLNYKRKYSQIVQEFIPVTHHIKDKTIQKYKLYFNKLNGKQVHDFIPTFFEAKSVIVAPRTFWNRLNEKYNIPCIYYPSPHEEDNQRIEKSIDALQDNIIFFTSKYNVCYENILIKKNRIDTIMIYNCEEENINQIIQDMDRYNFNLIILTNSLTPTFSGRILHWNWYKEEIDIINSI